MIRQKESVNLIGQLRLSGLRNQKKKNQKKPESQRPVGQHQICKHLHDGSHRGGEGVGAARIFKQVTIKEKKKSQI